MPRTSETVYRRESRRTINGVEYIISSVFSPNARETAEQKLLRLVREQAAAEAKNASLQPFLP